MLLAAYDEAIAIMTKILMQKETSWMAKKPNFNRFLEKLLLETVRRGLSQHFQGVTPCVGNDYSKLMTLVQFALGNYYLNSDNAF